MPALADAFSRAWPAPTWSPVNHRHISPRIATSRPTLYPKRWPEACINGGMKSIRIICFIVGIVYVLNFSYANATVPDSFYFDNDLVVISNSISGPGKSNSPLTEGVNYRNIFNAYGDGRAGDFTYRFNLGGKITDDPAFDMQQYSLTHFALKAASTRHAFSLGDTFEFFSRYTLSSGLKGGAYRYLGGDSPYVPEVTVLYGQAAPRWDALWGGRKTDILNRDVFGSRLQFQMEFPLQFGISIIDSQDSGAIHPWNTLLDNRVYSLDFHYKPLPGFTLTGESAFNDTDTRVADNRSSEEVDGYAVVLKAVEEKETFRILFEYERVDPDFKNPLGSVTPDREKVKIAGQYNFNKNIHLYTNFLWYQDNLDDRKSWGQTDVYIPEVTFAYTGLFDRQDALAKISYFKEIARRESEQIRHDDIYNFNYRDRFGFISADTNVGLKLHRNDVNSRIENKEITFNTNLSSRFSIDCLVVSPNLFLGGWTLKDELSTSDDRAYKYALGVGIDLPSGRLSSNWSLGVNDLEKDTGNNSSRTFGNFIINWQPNLLAGLKEMMLYMRGTFNDLEFSNEDENYRESTILAGIKIKY